MDFLVHSYLKTGKTLPPNTSLMKPQQSKSSHTFSMPTRWPRCPHVMQWNVTAGRGGGAHAPAAARVCVEPFPARRSDSSIWSGPWRGKER
jgi:hypothetical protein